jgi:hypothetical protein
MHAWRNVDARRMQGVFFFDEKCKEFKLEEEDERVSTYYWVKHPCATLNDAD